jgi:hypothetical protein
MPATKEPTIDEIRSWNEGRLLAWFQQILSKPLKQKYEKKLLNAEIDGEIFLNHAGDSEFFVRAGLSLGASDRLAQLAKDSIRRESEHCPCHLHYPNHATAS